MTMKETLIQKIQNRTLTMGVCGLGYVGLPLAVDKAKHGFKTIGFDVQKQKVDMVNNGQNYIGDVVDADLVNVKFVLKPAGFMINFRYGIGLQYIWVVDFSFYPCTFSLHG